MLSSAKDFKKIVLFLVVIFITSQLSVIYLFNNITNKAEHLQHHTSVVSHNVSDIKFNASQIHLWMMEYLSGDNFETVSIEVNKANITKLLDSLKNLEQLHTKEFTSLKRDTINISNKLAEIMGTYNQFIQSLDEFILHKGQTKNEFDARFDRIYTKLIVSLDQYEVISNQSFNSIKNDLKEEKFTIYLLILLIILVAIVTIYFIFKNELEKFKKIEQQNSLIEQQAKMSALGEMIGNIAHQWRQPLSSISIGATGLLFKKESNMLNDEDFVKSLEDINEKAQYLSETIDTFKNFIKGEKDKTPTTLQKQIDKSINLINASLKQNFVTVNKNLIDERLDVILYSGELEQVIINIINNAKDALVSNKIQSPSINITLYKKEELGIITIEDNAGGIPKDVLPRIFEPYFTTKHESQGTGLGLHMSYKIITESIGGNIYATNSSEGAIFTIEVPLEKSKA